MKTYKVEQGTKEWLDLRKGKITGTRLKQLMGANQMDLVDEIVAELFSDEIIEAYKSKAMERGTEFEPIAKKSYKKETFTSKIHEVGFCISDKYPFLGLSPDGWVGSNGAIEIKCPNTDTHVKRIRQNKIPAEYFYQIVCYFIVNEDLDWLDFVSFDDRFKEQPLFIKRVTREELRSDIEKVEKELSTFWGKVEEFCKKKGWQWTY